MTDVVGAGAAVRGEASAPRDPGWAGLLLAVLAIALLPSAPLLQVFVPITQPMLLLVPALAALTLVGWAAGGPFWLAVVWTGIAIATVRAFPSPATALSTLSKGWALLVAGLFGVLSLGADQRTKFFPRALAAVAIALAIGGLGLLTSGSSAHALHQSIDSEIASRPNVFADTVSRLLEERASADSAHRLGLPAMDSTTRMQVDSAARAYITNFEQVITTVPVQWGQQLFVALLALESLTVLALAWGLYHRISRTRIGPPLGRLRDFRFADELVWGLIVGIVFVILPRMTTTLPNWSLAGYNLLVFFGTLYALRGLGVSAWFIQSARFGGVTLVAIAFVVLVLAITPLLAPILGLIGLGDTFEDWRARPRPTV
jgi:hypothetical protein